MAIHQWMLTHPLWALFAWAVLSGIVTAVFQARTPAELAALPKWAARALLFIAATGIDSAMLLRVLRKELGLPSIPPPPPGDST